MGTERIQRKIMYNNMFVTRKRGRPIKRWQQEVEEVLIKRGIERMEGASS